MQKVGFIYDDIFLRHETPQGHPERKERLISVLNALKNSSLWDKLIHIPPRRADPDDIALVHDLTYIEKIKNHGPGYLDADTYVSHDSFEVAVYAAGSVIEAVKRCSEKEMQRAFCAVRPPGHHASSNRTSGFCIFNNVAIGARFAQKIGYKRVFIVDFDVHHGDGTQQTFENDDTVFFFSTHQYPHYPGTGDDLERGTGKGEGYTYNITMHAGSGDKEYIYAYQNVLPEITRKFKPDLILVSAGYDIHMNEPLADIRVSNEGVRSIVHNILSCTMKPVLFVLEGGYDLTALGDSVRITLEEMLKN